MPISTATAIQGEGVSFKQTLSVSDFQGDETLLAVISTGGTSAALLTLTPTWTTGQTTGAYGIIDIALTSTQTASLAPGYYVVQTSLSDHSCALAWTLLEVVAAAGQAPDYDWLVQPAEVLGLVPALVQTANLADLPRIIGVTTDYIRRYCRRWFTRRVLTKEFMPNLYGQVRLDEIPVNQVLRVATGRTQAMTLRGPTSAQLASARFAYTGDQESGLVITGLTLSSTASAVTTTSTLAFEDYETIGSLATAIADLGTGWSVDVVGGYGEWPTAELVGGDMAQGALRSGGAVLDVYSEDAAQMSLDPDTGMLQISRYSSTGLDSPAWGPDWQQFVSPQRNGNRVKVTYDAGFDTIPSPVVMAAIETIQYVFSRLQADQVIQSETAGDYSYEFRDQLGSLPDSVRDVLSPYRIFNA